MPPATAHHNALVLFLRRALADQRAVGAVAPTSAVLGRRIAELVPDDRGTRVLEMGAGTGAISRAVVPRLGPAGSYVAVERDPALLGALTAAAPGATVVGGDAADAAEHLAAAGLEAVDVVVSSLPWSNVDDATQDRLLAAVVDALTPTGTFVTIAYRPTRLRRSSRRFHARLSASFARVVTSSTTWANLPPARLLVARGLRPVDGRGENAPPRW